MTPATTVEMLNALDADQMIEGYWAGFKSQPNYTRKEQAYWHGYLNGQVDSGAAPISDEQRALARAVVASWRAH